MRRVNLFTIPAGLSFADELARGVLQRFGSADDPLAISRALILLPTRRSIRTLGEAFARVSPAGVCALPRMRALGDFDEPEERTSDSEDEAFTPDLPTGLAEPLKALKRELLLTKLIQHWSRAQGRDGSIERIGAESPALALRLARDLVQLLDQATAEGLDWTRLEALVPTELASHWSKTLGFLEILTQNWPAMLAQQEASDPAAHRDAALRKAAADWADQPPDHPVIAAGSTGSVPATALLLKTIAYLPQGAVVLPGLDLELDDEGFEATEPGHPQHGMRQLLGKMEATRKDVVHWGTSAPANPARVRLIAEALRPAETTPRWQAFVEQGHDVIAAGLKGLSSVVARTPSEEALTIACALREAVEIPGKTAALVTPDRNLARRVASEMRRWGIAIDDSAGVPLSQTEPGRFLCLMADAAAEEFAPVPLLALLKHPMTALGFARRAEARHLAVQLEDKVLRGPRPAAGLQGLRVLADPKEPYYRLIDRLESAYGSFASMMADGTHDLKDLADAHFKAAGIASEEESAEATFVWEREAGEAAHATLLELASAADGLELVMTGSDYASLIRAVMDAVPVRPHTGQHPRLSILGPLEARLQRADLMILGGLNEGKWPPATDPGPWLNRPMRQSLGLSQPERRVGLSAHDFAQAAASPEVILSRAEKDGGAPTTPSRWLTRLNMLVDGAGLHDELVAGRLVELARDLDKPIGNARPIDAPQPRPPVSARPREMWVTDVERWVRDPYALYAKRILLLSPLDAIDELPGAAERGSNIHKALEGFVKKWPEQMPDDATAMKDLDALGRAAFGNLLERPGVRSFWWPRYERIAKWFLDFEKARRGGIVRVVAELKGKISFPAPAGEFVLKAKADRIEILPGSSIVVVDYKTGTAPPVAEVMAGFNPQLTLEAAIALEGGFPGVRASDIDGLLFVELSGGTIAGREKLLDPKKMSSTEAALDALRRFKGFVASFDHPDMPYLSKPHVKQERYEGDYDHLARVKEWSSAEG